VSLVSAGHDALLGVGAHRPGHRPFRNEETGRIEPVLRHLHRAMAVHQRLTVAEEEKRSLADLLDRLRAGAVLVDARARVLLANAAARGFASAADGLTIADDLRGATAAVTARVRRAVAEASDGGNGSTLPLPRPSGRAPYRALVVPLVGSREQARLERVRASALVLITDPDPPLVVEPAALRSYLALTPTEARVTADLLAGHSTERIAARLGISIETVRVHVRHTLTKTGATSRAELIARLLATLPQTVLSTRDA
jgi:DNA-binding CsgD family transcriptional regulator